MKKRLSLVLLPFLLTQCAIMFKYQLGDIDSSGSELAPFEVIVSERGFNLEEAGAVSRSMMQASNNPEAAKQLKMIQDIISLFQFGPRTGNPVFNDDYADMIYQEIDYKCPSGQVTGLAIVRESNKYPIVSGEIVKVTGYCKTGIAPQNEDQKENNNNATLESTNEI